MGTSVFTPFRQAAPIPSSIAPASDSSVSLLRRLIAVGVIPAEEYDKLDATERQEIAARESDEARLLDALDRHKVAN